MTSLLIPLLAATNDVATAAAGSASSSGPSAGTTWWWLGGAAVVAATAATVAKFVKSAPSAERLDKDELLDDILAVVAKDEPNRDALRTELAAVMTGTAKPASPALAALLRIEESYEKLPTGKYRRRVSILRSKGGSPSGMLSKVESEVSWEYVPEAVRGEFIRTRQGKVVRLIYEAEKGEA